MAGGGSFVSITQTEWNVQVFLFFARNSFTARPMLIFRLLFAYFYSSLIKTPTGHEEESVVVMVDGGGYWD